MSEKVTPATSGVGTPFPNKKAETNSWIKSAFAYKNFQMDLFVSLCKLLTSSANLLVASPSVRSQLCFSVIFWIPHLEVTLLVQKGVGTRTHTKKRCGNAIPTPLHPWWWSRSLKLVFRFHIYRFWGKRVIQLMQCLFSDFLEQIVLEPEPKTSR